MLPSMQKGAIFLGSPQIQNMGFDPYSPAELHSESEPQISCF